MSNLFKNRIGNNLNRRKLTIVSQTANEMIVDVERADNVQQVYQGTILNDDESPLEIKKYLYKSEGWRDQLMGYTIKTIDYNTDDVIINDYSIGNYDSLGNPHTYNGKIMSWTRGRCLDSFDGNNFEYNADGIRTKKNNTTYVLNETKILSQTETYEENGQPATRTLVFQYGSNRLEGFTFNGTQYVYQKNILGDIIGIFDRFIFREY